MSLSAADLLACSLSQPRVIQAFRPFAESLEWQLGQRYLRECGNLAFISDVAPVPYVVNNDGYLASNSAELLFLHFEQGLPSSDDRINVLEIGVGVGLFARFFLNRFQELCVEHNRDFYNRLTYFLADYSEQMLMDVARGGLLADHFGHYEFRVVDAMQR